MSWTQYFFRKIDLENGLELEIYDVSRKLAGDRWYVGFIARVEIPITFLAGHADSAEIDLEKMKGVRRTISFFFPGVIWLYLLSKAPI